MPKKIAIGSLILAVLGIIGEIWFNSYSAPLYIKYIKGFISVLTYRVPGQTEIYNVESINYVALFLYGLLLTGSISYLISKKETRLLRFLFSLIFFSKALGLLFYVINIFFVYKQIKGYMFLLLYLISFVFLLFWLFISYRVMRFFANQRQLEIESRTYSGEDIKMLAEATRGQRFFNRLCDFICIILLFTSFTKRLMETRFVKELGSTDIATGRLIVYAFILIVQLIFYWFFETMFQATPGKLLSGTVVVNNDGKKPSGSQLVKRTFSRIVPFEAFSTLFGRPWHDEWSETYVIKEKNDGIKAGIYLLIIPILLFVGGGAFFTNMYLKEHRAEAESQAVFERKRDKLLYELNHLTQEKTIKLSRNYEKSIYLKTEKVTPENITFSVMRNTNPYNFDTQQYVLEKLYAERKDTLPKIILTRAELEKALNRKYEPGFSYEQHGTDLLKEGLQYEVKEIITWYSPNLELESINTHDNPSGNESLSIYLKNAGWPAEIIKATDKTGSGYTWDNIFPANVGRRMHGNSPDGAILTAVAEDIGDIDVEITVKDSLNKTQVYRITARDGYYDYGEIVKIK